MNESGRQAVPTALPSGYASGITTAGIAPGPGVFIGQEWIAGSNSHFTTVLSGYPSELPLPESIRQPYYASLNAPSPNYLNSVIDVNHQVPFSKTLVDKSGYSLTFGSPLPPQATTVFTPGLRSSETPELRTGEALLSNVPNNDASAEGLSARLLSRSPTNGMARNVPTSNPPSRDGTPANVGQYRPWEQMAAGGDYPHSQPSTPQSMSDMQNETNQRPPSASADKNTLKEMENRLYKSPEYMAKTPQMSDPIQPPRSVETPGRPPSGISSANSPSELQEGHLMEENIDQENVGQVFTQSHNFSNYFPDNRLGHINMQVSHALKLPSVYARSNNSAQVPYVPVTQVMMGYPEAKLLKLDPELTDLDMRGNTENTFQVPSVSSTTPRQSIAAVPQPHPAQLNQWDHGSMQSIPNLPPAQDMEKGVKKKRKRCGECPGCLTKNNCGLCGPCKSVRSHQICKMRKCDELKTKKEKAAAAKASGQLMFDNDSSKSLNGQNSYQESDSLQLPSTPTSFQHEMLISGNQLKSLNQSPGSNNSFVDINSSYPGFAPQHNMMPFNGPLTPVESLKLDPQGLSSDHQSLKDFSGADIHEITTARIKNLVNSRRNQKEQMQNYANSQNLGSMYSEPSPSPVAASPQNDADAYAQRPPSTPTYMRSRAGSNPSDSGIQNEDSAYLTHSVETTYENLKNLVPPSPEASWQKNGSPTDLENISKSIQNGQSTEEAIKEFMAENGNNVDGSISYPVVGQDSLNGFPYRSFFNAGNLHVNSTLDSYGANSSTRDVYSTPSTNTSPGNYASQNAQTMYNSQYYPTQEMNMQPATQNETPQTATTPSNQNQPQPPPSQSQDPSSSVEERPTEHQSTDPPANGSSGGHSSSSASSPERLVSKTPNLSSQQESSDPFLLSTTTSMNTYSNTISSYNPSPSNFTLQNSVVTLPAIASIFSSGHSVISNAATDLGSQLKVSYANQHSGTTPHWVGGVPLTSTIDSGRNEVLCGLDPSFHGLYSLISTSMPNAVLTTGAIDVAKGYPVSQQENIWWEQMKNTVKLEVPPASPECEVLENKPSSPSTV